MPSRPERRATTPRVPERSSRASRPRPHISRAGRRTPVLRDIFCPSVLLDIFRTRPRKPVFRAIFRPPVLRNIFRPLARRALVCAPALLLALACGTAGEPAFQAPLRARGGAAEFLAGAWTVTLTRADVAVGPLYLCATAAASADLCPSAVAEFTAVAAADALAPAAQELGDLDALPAEARSAMLDYGVTWLATQTQPKAQDGAPGRRSARFAGTAVRGDMSIAFTADLDLTPALRGSRVVEGLRLGPADLAPGGALDVELQPAVWWAGVDFDALATLGPGPLDLAALAAEDPASPAKGALDAVRFAMIAAPPRLTWIPPED